MGAYGEGAPGVFLVTELGGGGGYDRGRIFKLSEPADLQAIVETRLAGRRPYVPEAAFGGISDLWDRAAGEDPEDGGEEGEGARLGGDRPPRPDGLGGLAGRIAAARELARREPRAPDVDPGAVAAAIAARSSTRSTPRIFPVVVWPRRWRRCSPHRAGPRPARPPRRSAAAT
jgi:hypothetical protein